MRLIGKQNNEVHYIYSRLVRSSKKNEMFRNLNFLSITMFFLSYWEFDSMFAYIFNFWKII